jgi:hypothetical protein
MGSFIEDLALDGSPRVVCQSCGTSITKRADRTDTGWKSEVYTYKEHHEHCNGALFNRIVAMLEKRGIFSAAAVKTAGYVHLAITTGRYNDMLGEQNKNSREVFKELTGIKVPLSSSKRVPVFTGVPFTVKGE